MCPSPFVLTFFSLNLKYFTKSPFLTFCHLKMTPTPPTWSPLKDIKSSAVHMGGALSFEMTFLLFHLKFSFLSGSILYNIQLLLLKATVMTLHITVPLPNYKYICLDTFCKLKMIFHKLSSL